ncbi:Rieske (2Fe-2S) protein [Prolixibacteraceae bacterium Z1-6]|uniref:Rieske (2Fe-2S) protein n=1 Tax=Draconibacterium aestuarii TaxID=2998507 RepID=A0A9X3J6C4_9BACT|nr:Rieske (2Fe-2S) protein [Prolixibacteraceae bacterium Z1-6]
MATNTRRTFLKIAAAGIAAIFVFLWNKLIVNHLATSQQSKSVFPFNKNKTVSFIDNYIVVNNEGTTTVLSSKCSHLGCTINNAENGKLVCPCHGSEYDLTGKILKGPAYKNLEIIPSKITENGQNIEIGS